MFSYAPLMSTLHKRKLSKTELQKLINVSSATIAKISKDQHVSLKVIDDICEVLDCNVDDVITHIKVKNHQSI
uniref:helix-turn-helix domain-containing protein n=1 Tax=Peribacillus kribbensis TaxID=356658 RepID=UPI00047E96BF|nr:helix-turn-helix transcriptional regulator [Peribacillus kribbensis]